MEIPVSFHSSQSDVRVERSILLYKSKTFTRLLCLHLKGFELLTRRCPNPDNPWTRERWEATKSLKFDIKWTERPIAVAQLLRKRLNQLNFRLPKELQRDVELSRVFPLNLCCSSSEHELDLGNALADLERSREGDESANSGFQSIVLNSILPLLFLPFEEFFLAIRLGYFLRFSDRQIYAT